LFFWRDILAVQWFGECEDDVLMDEDSLLGSLKLKAINQYKRPFLKIICARCSAQIFLKKKLKEYFLICQFSPPFQDRKTGSEGYLELV